MKGIIEKERCDKSMNVSTGLVLNDIMLLVMIIVMIILVYCNSMI